MRGWPSEKRNKTRGVKFCVAGNTRETLTSVVTPDISRVIGAAAILGIEMKIDLVIVLGPEKEATLATATTGATIKRKYHFLNRKLIG